MIRATVMAYDKEQSENEARTVGANWFRCRPEEVTLKAVRTEATDITTTYTRPTSTVYRTEYKIYGPGEHYDD